MYIQDEIRKKGFAMDFQRVLSADDVSGREPIDYSKVKVGMKRLEDAVIRLGTLKKTHAEYTNKEVVLAAIRDGDIDKMREISRFFYKVSGIYPRLCRHMAFLYKYDWTLDCHIADKKKVKKDKVASEFYNCLRYLDKLNIKSFCGDAALDVFRDGCKYLYLVDSNGLTYYQDLPASHCRSRYSINGRPVVEFNMRYFDETFKDTAQRLRMLKMFPVEFSKGYVLYKEGKLKAEYPGDKAGWYVLDVNNTIKFNINGEDFPAFIAVIPAIIDLDAAQALDRKKMAQQLLKIIIQKMPMDKNGELIFDVDEAQQLHNNAVRMLQKAIGIDVLTTFADVEVADMADNQSQASLDQLHKYERAVFNESGTAENLFNTDGNIALEKSIMNDEAALYNLILQFESFLNSLLEPFNKNPKKVCYKVQILTTTIYNYKEMAKLYKEQTQ